MSIRDSDVRDDYESPALRVIGSLRDLTAQKSGSEPDGLKGEGDFVFPSGFQPPSQA